MDLAVSLRYSDQAIGWSTNESCGSIAGKCLGIFFLQIVQTVFDAHPTFSSVGTGNFPWSYNLITRLHAATKLGIWVYGASLPRLRALHT